jgi:cytoskeletal protein CcmA (bactofilin family)
MAVTDPARPPGEEASMRSLIPCLLALTLPAVSLASQQHDAGFGSDRFIAGDDVRVEEAIAGDAFLAGGRTELRSRVAGDVVVTGGQVDLTGDVGQDLYAAGGDVRVESLVEGNVRAAGGTVEVARYADLRGSATLAGGRVLVGGKVAGNVQAYGNRVTIDGEIGGDVDVSAEEIQIGPTARIGGRLTYRSPNEAEIGPGAAVAGGIGRRGGSDGGWDARPGFGGVVAGIGRAMWFTGVFLTGIVLLLLMPRFTREAAAGVRSDALASAALGFAILVAVPIGILMLFITIIGIPLGLAAMFGYGLLLILGYFTAALFIGDLLLLRLGEPRASRTPWRIAFLLLGLVVLALLRHVPWIGGAAVFVLFLAGLGAWTLRSWRGFGGRPAAT